MTGKQHTEGEQNRTRFGQPASGDAARQGTGSGTAQPNAAFPTGIAVPAIRALTAAEDRSSGRRPRRGRSGHAGGSWTSPWTAILGSGPMIAVRCRCVPTARRANLSTYAR